KGYFKPKVISQTTIDHIPGCIESEAKFDYVNEGFTFEDTFILKKQDEEYDVLISLVKNRRDETLIPCPACRSLNIQGNSYPIIGVRSWECNNKFCPDRSKYNRGKRYALSSIIKQQAIDDDNNKITQESLRKWKFDIVQTDND